MVRLLEVVLNESRTFWLYTCLVESILPLNFYTNTLYPQAFCEYTCQLVKEYDKAFYGIAGDSIRLFCLKSYYNLFTNLSIEKNEREGSASEMCYFMLDLLFLLGSPRESTTLRDDVLNDGEFTVGETIPSMERVNVKQRAKLSEKKVRIDRTSQLLIAMSISIADMVK